MSLLDSINSNPNSETREVLFEKINQFAFMKYHRRKIVIKWKNSGLLDGLEFGNCNPNMALLLESQASQLINENILNQPPVFISSRGFKKNIWTKIKEFFVSVWHKLIHKKKESLTNFDVVALPLVRRVFVQTTALDLVSVQPLSQPTGLLFYMDEVEKENVYKSKVIIEKHKNICVRTYPVYDNWESIYTR